MKTFRNDFSYYVRRFVYFFGWFSLCVVIVIAGVIGIAEIDRATSTKHLTEGVIIDKAYNNGDVYESRWKIGDYTISRKSDGNSYFYVTVLSGGYEDHWRVSAEEWQKMKIGDYVKR